jgi:hypothetical protein
LQQWKIRVRGTPRKEVDIALLIQAVVALGRQLGQEAPDTGNQQSEVEQRREET